MSIVQCHLYEVPKIGKFIKTESRTAVTKGGESGDEGVIVKRVYFQFEMRKKFCEWTVVVVAQPCECT